MIASEYICRPAITNARIKNIADFMTVVVGDQ